MTISINVFLSFPIIHRVSGLCESLISLSQEHEKSLPLDVVACLMNLWAFLVEMQTNEIHTEFNEHGGSDRWPSDAVVVVLPTPSAAKPLGHGEQPRPSVGQHGPRGRGRETGQQLRIRKRNTLEHSHDTSVRYDRQAALLHRRPGDAGMEALRQRAVRFDSINLYVAHSI